jgi:Cft2 family RNA processing exonuclease
MKFTDLNRSGGIGANSSLIEIGSFRFLIDSGLHPKHIGNDALPDHGKAINGDLDFIVLTHCHLDHLGSLPVIAKRHQNIPIFLSMPSKMLAPRMLRNSVNVMKRQRKEHGIAEYPLFTFNDIGLLERQFQPLRFEQPEVLTKGKDKMTITLYPSGHVAGAASLLVEHESQSIYFTGDILFDDLMTLSGARIPDIEVDVVVTETTRGLTARISDRDRDSEWDRLFEGIAKTIQSGGSVLLPVFALGRMQEVLVALNTARKRGRIPKCPVFSAGLGMDIVDYFDQITRETGLLKFRKKVVKELGVKSPTFTQNPGFEHLTPGIYVLSSGMMVEHTPSYVAASSLLHNPVNSIYFLGYCDPDTPGGKLRACAQGDTFHFEAYDLESQVLANIDAFDLSGHADREELMDLIAEFSPKTVVLTHGDAEARQWFEHQLKSEDLVESVLDPEPGTTYTV